jgi:1-acyl-sn-glycerol-3-phosphate acyltransferase
VILSSVQYGGILIQFDTSQPDPREKQVFFLRESGLRKFAKIALNPLFNIMVDLHTEGVINLPAEGACIVVANHLNELDVFPMQLALPRPLFFMAKAELFINPISGWIIRRLGAFPVHRGVSDQWALAHAREVLDKGLVLAMFPEGARSRGRGLSVAKTGAARLAIEKHVPIIVLAISGSQRNFSRFPSRTLIQIRVAPPIYPQQDDDPLSLTDRMMFTLSATLPRELRGVYSDIPVEFLRDSV